MPRTEWLSQFPALLSIGDPAWLEALASVRLVTIPEGVTLFNEGESCSSYLLVLDGSVRVQKISESGREIVLYRVEAGQSCVLTTACLLADERYHAEAVTESAVTAAALPCGAFRRALDLSPGFRQFVFASYGSRVADLLTLIDAVAFGRMDERLADRLLELGGAAGETRATHQALARELGTAREVVSRLLKEFERRGWVRLHRGRIELCDCAALRRIGPRV